jgi:PIN domain nuclease of toxin-antitoxin system
MPEERWRAGNLSFVSAMTAWEMARRADGGLIELDLAPDA